MTKNLPTPIEAVIDALSSIPGIGGKSAFRHALHLSTLSRPQLEEFAHSILSLSELRRCKECSLFCEDELCSVCSSPKRETSSQLCVIENYSDYMAIEKGGAFLGRYHLLGGVLNPLLGIGPEQLNLNQLITRVKEGGYREIILALNSSVEGDATCAYLKSKLGEYAAVERIGFGIPMGGNLEYLDALTISKAFENRRKL